MEELDHAASGPIFRAGIQDKSIRRILGMLMEELEAERPSGRLYVDSLAHALAEDQLEEATLLRVPRSSLQLPA